MQNKIYKLIGAESFNDQMSRLYPNKKTQQITFQVTEDCCMRCTYCYQNNKTHNKMGFNTAKVFIDNLLEDKYEFANTQKTQAVVLDFIGGEPLMEIDLIHQIVEYYLNKCIELNHPWLYFTKFSICSNGLLYFEPRVQEFFKKYSKFCSFSISIDGNQELHDLCRLDKAGNGTYERAIKASKDYQNRYGSIPPTKMTLSPQNINYVYDAILNLIKEGYNEIPLNCIFEKGWNENHAQIFYNQLKKVANYIIDNKLYDKVYISLLDEDLFKPMSEDDNQNWCGGILDGGISINHTGRFYPCLRYMESSLNGKQPPIILGSIDDGYLTKLEYKNNAELVSNITRRSQSTDECFNCPIASGCAWCSGLNYEETGTPNKRLINICIMHQARSLANVYYWNKLYNTLNIDKVFKLNLSKDKALKIIDEKEFNNLLDLSKGE